MSIHTDTSVPSMSSGPRGRLGRNFLVAGAGGVIVAAAVAAGLWARSDRTETASPAIQAAVAVQPASTGSLVVSRASGGYTPHTVYIVGSEEQAAMVRNGINEADDIRNASNLPPMLDEVIVALTDEEAAAIVFAQNDSNTILASLYGVENRIVDLRG